MSQIFNLQLATGKTASDAQQLGVTIEQLQRISVNVSATIVQQPQPSLWLTYQINLPHVHSDTHKRLSTQLNWPRWEQDKVGFSDYLWEQTCLECFIASDIRSYVEINASPSGHYALYKFDDYRSPSALPPLALLKQDGQGRANIEWRHPHIDANTANNDSHLSQNNHLAYQSHQTYQRSFGITLKQLPFDLLDTHETKVLLHPCVILQFGETNLYFAATHSTPPDFHQRQYWPVLDYEAVLTK